MTAPPGQRHGLARHERRRPAAGEQPDQLGDLRRLGDAAERYGRRGRLHPAGRGVAGIRLARQLLKELPESVHTQPTYVRPRT